MVELKKSQDDIKELKNTINDFRASLQFTENEFKEKIESLEKKHKRNHKFLKVFSSFYEKYFPLTKVKVIDKTEIVGETKIANEFNKFFLNICPKLAQKILQLVKHFESYMSKVNSEMENEPITVNELKEAF